METLSIGVAADVPTLVVACVLAVCESCATAASGVADMDTATITAKAAGAMRGCFISAGVFLFLSAGSVSVVSYI